LTAGITQRGARARARTSLALTLNVSERATLINSFVESMDADLT